jgi:hypothetical protein
LDSDVERWEKFVEGGGLSWRCTKDAQICLDGVELDMCIIEHSSKTRVARMGLYYLVSQCLGCQREQVCNIGYGVIVKSGENVMDSFVLTICAKIVEVLVGATCK